MWIGTAVLASGALVAAVLPFTIRAVSSDSAAVASAESSGARIAHAAA